MRDERLISVRVRDRGEIAELLVSDLAQNLGIPGGSYDPGIRILMRTADGRAYSGMVYFGDLINHLKKVESPSGRKLVKKCEIDT